MEVEYFTKELGVQVDIFARMTFGEGLYLWRIYRGLTQEELAARADVTNDTISRHERRSGDDRPPTEPSQKTKSRLAKALSINPEDFYRPPTESIEQALTLEDIMSQLKSVYGSGKYTTDEIEKEVLKFWLEIKGGEKN